MIELMEPAYQKMEPTKDIEMPRRFHFDIPQDTFLPKSPGKTASGAPKTRFLTSTGSYFNGSSS
jgi:hypothetical protein